VLLFEESHTPALGSQARGEDGGHLYLEGAESLLFIFATIVCVKIMGVT
jgi:hypothetical protein